MSFWSSITGKDAAKAAQMGAAMQQSYAQQGIKEQEQAYGDVSQMLSPFSEAGKETLPMLQALLTGQGQTEYLQNNPIFQASLERLDRDTGAMQAARGRLGSGGTLEALRSNYMATANPLIQQAFGNALNLGQLGYNATAGMGNARMNLANNVTDLYGQIGNAGAAGLIGAANARAQGYGNILNTAAQVGGAFIGGGFNPFSFLGGGAPSMGANSYINDMILGGAKF